MFHGYRIYTLRGMKASVDFCAFVKGFFCRKYIERNHTRRAKPFFSPSKYFISKYLSISEFCWNLCLGAKT